MRILRSFKLVQLQDVLNVVPIAYSIRSCNVMLTVESVEKILKFNHSNERY